MRKFFLGTTLLYSLFTAPIASLGQQAAPTPPQQPAPVAPLSMGLGAAGISQEANQAVSAMGDALSNGTFAFTFTTFREYEKDNLLLHIVHSGEVIVRKPDRLSVDIDGDDGQVRITYDGSKLTIFNITQNKYVQMPITGSIETMLRAASEKFRLDFPLADFLADKPAQSFLHGAVYGVKVGTVTIDGEECNHFFFEQPPGIEFELWTETGKESLPRRVAIAYGSLPGVPQFLAALSDWQLNVEVPDSEFAANVPDDAEAMGPETKQ